MLGDAEHALAGGLGRDRCQLSHLVEQVVYENVDLAEVALGNFAECVMDGEQELIGFGYDFAALLAVIFRLGRDVAQGAEQSSISALLASDDFSSFLALASSWRSAE
jgi:hypothetical protein